MLRDGSADRYAPSRIHKRNICPYVLPSSVRRKIVNRERWGKEGKEGEGKIKGRERIG